ncbi:gamma carbonic anhydrase family protein [Chelatococcus reniformis]|uniref:Gamma carbonic anhydrase family protein n=1 Tax=Chelatococcus reniformis TaxID=1494448 RepID=A0A916XGH5_9HYPH|nr:gamma carbonic anhydrase family protein [Chelatococcus reniformis]GGC71621.1 gamma carbonic anhydrase family protein [Chelatococcus reniformis]
MTVYALDNHSPQLPQDGLFWIAPGAHMMGNVRLGHEASVWFGAVIRGDNDLIDIGSRSNIQDLAMLHTDPGAPITIGEDCTIGHTAILHGCTIGPGSLIGMGATVLNRARIGAGSIVGANSLIAEGKTFPDNSLILGSPARVVRTLSDEEVARTRASSAHYVSNWKRFVAGLRPVG